MRMLTGVVAVMFTGGITQAQPVPSLSDDVRAFVQTDSPVVALTHVQVVDGTGAPAVPDQTIVLRDGRIAALGPVGSVEVPEGAEVLRRPGHTVIPGIVGLHGHTFYMTRGRRVQLNFSAPRLYLASGVTTIRTTGAFSPYSELNLKQSIADGQVVGPRMYITGPYITGAGAMTQMKAVSSPDDARRVVGYWADEGAVSYPHLPLPTNREV